MQNAPKPANTLANYWPLICLILVSALAATAITWPREASGMEWMHYFMGIFLCCFAMLKLFNLKGFAKGFMMYDLLAKRSRAYAMVYPFIELALGLGYLSFAAPTFVYKATVLVMLFSAVGVVLALRKGLNINCPCMGTVLKVPLSTVTLTEDFAMGAMAFAMLLN